LIVICFLFILGILVIRNRQKWWMVAVSALAIAMSWGNHFAGFNYFLFDHLPMLNKFRTPSMILVLPELLFPVIAVWAVQEVINRKDADNTLLWKDVKIAAGITAGLCLVIGLLGSMFFSYTGGMDSHIPEQYLKLLREDRSSLATKSSLMSALYILLAAAAIWAYIKAKIKKPVLFIALGLIVAVDMLPVAAHYLGADSDKYKDASDYDAFFESTLVDRKVKRAYDAILQDKDPYFRVFDLSNDPYNDAVQAYYFKCIGGYHPAKMEAYQDLIETYLSSRMNSQVVNMLNTKYIIVAQQGSDAGLIPNPQANGNAWFVNEVKWANTADEEMSMMNAQALGDTTQMPAAFNSKNTAIIRSSFKNDLNGYNFGKDSSAKIKLAKYGLDEIYFESNNTQNGLAVFSDIYYPHGWTALVDGKETPILKVDYVLRAIKIPAGNHKIEFYFKPKSVSTGNTLALISSFLIIGLCLGAFYKLYKKNPELK